MILMNRDFKNVEFLKKITNEDYENFLKLSPMIPFSDSIIKYLDALSKEINNDSRIRDYPDVATFSFFCRKANISRLKKKFNDDQIIKLGRGVLFHIAPSNVPVNFGFSMIMGLLSGNCNVVRVPSINFDQINIIVSAINRLANNSRYILISNRIILVRYDRNDIATKFFSLDCDIRIIWGGDETIKEIRKNDLQPRAFDITFADRYSLCAINANEFINNKNPIKIANDFYNDTYLIDQNACTSPHLILWIGSKNNVTISKKIFWECLYNIVKDKYEIKPVSAINKLTTLYEQAIMMDKITLEHSKDNLILRTNLNNLEYNIDSFRCDSGYFSEYNSSSLKDLSKIINRKYQTLSYYGFDKDYLSNVIDELKPCGIDRVVPIGRTMDFSLIWDGYNIIESMSRNIEIV